MNDPTGDTRILVVDDDPQVAALLSRLLARKGYVVEVAGDGETALSAVHGHPPDIILLDMVMPGVGGLDVCRALKRDAATRLVPVVMITGLADRDSRLRGFEAGADEFLTKPIDPGELVARVRSLARLKRYTDDLDSASSIIMALAAMIEARDGYTEGHCHRLANYATSLGRRLGLGQTDLQTLRRGGYLHDIGMLAISGSVLRRPGRLEPEEFELIKSHTVIGDRLCSNLRSLSPVRPIIRHHHERLDGSGYPDGLAGDAIPLLAQIVGIVDVYDAVTTQKPYQRARSIETALVLLREQVERGWRRPDLVLEFAALVRSGHFDSYAAGPTPVHDPPFVQDIEALREHIGSLEAFGSTFRA
jgi:putative two-component system response regulator